MSGVEAVLDADTGEGYLLIRDEATFAELQAKYVELETLGWVDVDRVAAEPVDFPDGGVGVKTWLCRQDGVA